MLQRGRQMGAETTSRGLTRGIGRSVVLPLWVDTALVDAAPMLGITVSELVRALLISPMVANAGLPPEAAVAMRYAREKDVINQVRAKAMKMRREAVEEPVPPDRIEAIRVREAEE